MQPESDAAVVASAPGVAVVVPVFNKAVFVAATLASLKAQTYQNIELIVVDDGSTDGSLDVVRQTIEGLRARTIVLQNGGVSRARNVGAAAASTEAKYLLFLDADDILAPDAIGSLVTHLERHPEAVACYSRLLYIGADDRPLTEIPSDIRWAPSGLGRRVLPDASLVTPLEAIWSRYWAIPSCCLIRRGAFEATDGWNTSLCPPATIFGAEDKDMAIQLALQGAIHRLPGRLVSYRVMANDRRDALYLGLRELDVKWWSAELRDEDRDRVRRAIRFDSKVAALDAIGAFVRTATHQSSEEEPGSATRMLRSSLRYVLAGPLMTYWSWKARKVAGSPDASGSPQLEGDGMAETRAPRVSIGLPVYNGEDYLEEAIGSILSQTYSDFELIISDNASTDLTEKICRKYAAQDDRIVYSRNSRNIGGMKNANLTFRRSRGEFFRFAGHDDRYAPTLLERLVEALDERPDATISYAATVHIDGQGNHIDVWSPTEGTAPTAVGRFGELVLSPRPGGAIYGLIRSDVLGRTRLLRSYTGSDYNLLCEIAMRGPFHFVQEPLFYNRVHEGNVYKDLRGRMAWARPELASSGRPTLPYWLQLAHYLEILVSAPLSRRERISCAALLTRWARLKWRSMAGDIALAAVMLVRGKQWRVARYAPERWWFDTAEDGSSTADSSDA